MHKIKRLIFVLAKERSVLLKNGLKKSASDIKTAFVLFGTVVGAGFVSGAELVRFFPLRGYFHYVLLAGLLMYAGFFLLLKLGAKTGGYEQTLRFVFGKFSSVFKIVISICSAVICASMLAGLDAVLCEGFGSELHFPVFSAAAVTLVFFLSGKGIGAVGIINLCLVPFIFIFIARLAGGYENTATFYGGNHPARCLILVFLYAGMNVFLAAPVVCDSGARGSGSFSALLSAAAIGFCISVILSVIFRSGANALTASMPLLYAVGGKGKTFSLICVCGILTTLFSSFYPLEGYIGKSRRTRLTRFIVCFVLFGFSRLGLKNIVAFAYPILGSAGLIFLFICAFRLLQEKKSDKKEARGKEVRRARSVSGDGV